MIDAKDLTKTYGNFVAVQDVTFTVKQGEVVGLLGPNGAGKTTIMRMLTGFTPPSKGQILIGDFDMARDPLDARQLIGYLPERVPLYTDMTVLEYLHYWAELRGMTDRKKRVERVHAILDEVHLSEKKRHLVRQLSKGMRQRLGIAQALVHQPRVIILDEPTIGIDPHQVIEVRQTVRALRNHHAVLFSTHILTEAEQVCDRLIILNRGQIIAQGTPSELRQRVQAGGAVYVETRERLSETEWQRLLNPIPHIRSIRMERDGVQLVMDGSDCRDAISTTIQSANLTLIEFSTHSLTLEDVFVALTNPQGNPRP